MGSSFRGPPREYEGMSLLSLVQSWDGGVYLSQLTTCCASDVEEGHGKRKRSSIDRLGSSRGRNKQIMQGHLGGRTRPMHIQSRHL
eukprot:4952772-Prymnesium_polylepis.1